LQASSSASAAATPAGANTQNSASKIDEQVKQFLSEMNSIGTEAHKCGLFSAHQMGCVHISLICFPLQVSVGRCVWYFSESVLFFPHQLLSHRWLTRLLCFQPARRKLGRIQFVDFGCSCVSHSIRSQSHAHCTNSLALLDQ
jgi:hypothetical protein